MVDITDHLKYLNKTMQGRNKVVKQFYDSLCAFQLNLTLWKVLLSNGDPANFPCLHDLRVTELAGAMCC